MRSLLPLVHGFPYPGDATGIARRRCTEPSTLPALAWSSGFYPPRCYQRFTGPESSVPPVNLPPSVPPRFGISSSSRFSVVSGNIDHSTGGLPWVRRTTSPYPVRLHVRLVLPDIRSRLITSARPPLQHHIAGSLFATYTGSASCFLQTHHLWICPCLVGVVLPSGNGGPSCPRLRLQQRPVRHARHT